MSKKIPKYQQDIARAQAISGCPIDRCEWWRRLSKASTQEQITVDVHTPIMPEVTVEDASKTEED